MNLSITTPQGRLFNGEVQSVVLPGVLGSFQVLANHAPTLSSLTAGRIIYTIGGKKNFFSVQSGLVSVSDNQIMVVCKPIEKQQ